MRPDKALLLAKRNSWTLRSPRSIKERRDAPTTVPPDSPTKHIHPHIMDSFAAITIPAESQPTNQEDGGGGGGTYCVVFAKEDVPVNEEDGGSGGGTYCVIA
ncbi:hypothetical protein LshimejAT787_1303160 [Lyophyllum shimeji]|uniref:Pheromone n=1 Tax=Lyophyllum shimeji TaxID=47721 RepID=A0A9P3PWR2_LYOSH|nr:hypothetical protein LshimejAT787_1303160 [Lyophyllum shimeji]